MKSLCTLSLALVAACALAHKVQQQQQIRPHDPAGCEQDFEAWVASTTAAGTGISVGDERQLLRLLQRNAELALTLAQEGVAALEDDPLWADSRGGPKFEVAVEARWLGNAVNLRTSGAMPAVSHQILGGSEHGQGAASNNTNEIRRLVREKLAERVVELQVWPEERMDPISCFQGARAHKLAVQVPRKVLLLAHQSAIAEHSALVGEISGAKYLASFSSHGMGFELELTRTPAGLTAVADPPGYMSTCPYDSKQAIISAMFASSAVCSEYSKARIFGGMDKSGGYPNCDAGTYCFTYSSAFSIAGFAAKDLRAISGERLRQINLGFETPGACELARNSTTGSCHRVEPCESGGSVLSILRASGCSRFAFSIARNSNLQLGSVNGQRG